MKNRLAVLFTVLAMAGLAGCDTPPRYGDVRVSDRHYDVRVVFSDSDRRIIREYYRPSDRRLPPGLAKKGKIPPGHAYKLKHNHSVPSDIRWAYLPSEVERRLSHLPDGYVRVVIGADVAIVRTRTRLVVDLFESIYD